MKRSEEGGPNAFGEGDDVYQQKYKGLHIVLLMVARALAGNYVNFGVFDLYEGTVVDGGRRW